MPPHFIQLPRRAPACWEVVGFAPGPVYPAGCEILVTGQDRLQMGPSSTNDRSDSFRFGSGMKRRWNSTVAFRILISVNVCRTLHFIEVQFSVGRHTHKSPARFKTGQCRFDRIKLPAPDWKVITKLMVWNHPFIFEFVIVNVDSYISRPVCWCHLHNDVDDVAFLVVVMLIRY